MPERGVALQARFKNTPTFLHPVIKLDLTVSLASRYRGKQAFVALRLYWLLQVKIRHAPSGWRIPTRSSIKWSTSSLRVIILDMIIHHVPLQLICRENVSERHIYMFIKLNSEQNCSDVIIISLNSTHSLDFPPLTTPLSWVRLEACPSPVYPQI